ncbi:perlucin-like protein [Mytilus edulis]|uniref:perlucin-like protein n=1 Tax=Mytilus edulis TaxID=6550 RepID=UPI0039EF224C
MIILCICLLISVVSASYTSQCVSLSAIQKYDKVRGPLQDIEKYLKTCRGSYSSKEPIVSMRRTIKKLEKKFADVNKEYYARKWSNEQKHNGHCYIFSKDRLTWEKAKKRCEEIGGYLVKVDNEKENRWLAERARKKSITFWIGLLSETEYNWKWANEDKKPEFLKFKKGYPNKNTSSPRCVILYYNDYGYWRNYSCSYSRNYVCETNKCL